MINKTVRNAVLRCSLKNDRMISVRFQGKPFSITVIHVYAPISNAEDSSYVSKEISSSICILCAFWLVFFGPTLKHHLTPNTSSDLRGFLGLSGSTECRPRGSHEGEDSPSRHGPAFSVWPSGFYWPAGLCESEVSTTHPEKGVGKQPTKLPTTRRGVFF